jgi:hypothetical protein
VTPPAAPAKSIYFTHSEGKIMSLGTLLFIIPVNHSDPAFSRAALGRVRLRSIAPLMGVVVLALAGCGEMATLPISTGTGPQPTLPPPSRR